jgi:putative flippase GtrA
LMLQTDHVHMPTTLEVPLNVGPAMAKLTVDVEIVIPVYNEQQALAASVQRLHRYLSEAFPFTWLITVADNASTDATWGTACLLAQQLSGVQAVHISQKGRGRALRAAWLQSRAAVVAYMDVDLSTDLAALLPLVAPLISGHSDLAIGSRLAQGAQVVRGPRREVISRAYNLILKATLHNSFSDAQCGFKAVRAEVARRLVPLVEDDGWFFDTELLVLAERNGLRVHEVAVDWVDDPDSRVDVVQTARDDLRGVKRMMLGLARGEGRLSPGDGEPRASGPRLRAGATGQLVHFAGVGAVSTACFAALFSLLYGPTGPVTADVVALALCAAGNLAANRRFTFASRGPVGRRHFYSWGLALGLLPLLITLSLLALLGAAGISGLGADLAGLTAANLSATGARFYFLRRSILQAAAMVDGRPAPRHIGR